MVLCEVGGTVVTAETLVSRQTMSICQLALASPLGVNPCKVGQVDGAMMILNGGHQYSLKCCSKQTLSL